jgi:hypothetical protein
MRNWKTIKPFWLELNSKTFFLQNSHEQECTARGRVRRKAIAQHPYSRFKFSYANLKHPPQRTFIHIPGSSRWACSILPHAGAQSL